MVLYVPRIAGASCSRQTQGRAAATEGRAAIFEFPVSTIPNPSDNERARPASTTEPPAARLRSPCRRTWTRPGSELATQHDAKIPSQPRSAASLQLTPLARGSPPQRAFRKQRAPVPLPAEGLANCTARLWLISRLWSISRPSMINLSCGQHHSGRFKRQGSLSVSHPAVSASLFDLDEGTEIVTPAAPGKQLIEY